MSFWIGFLIGLPVGAIALLGISAVMFSLDDPTPIPRQRP